MNLESMGQNLQNQEKAPSLSGEQTLAFLQEQGISILNPEAWTAGSPVIYVFEDHYRGDGSDGKSFAPFKDLSIDRRPSLAYIHTPTAIDFKNPRWDDDAPERKVHDLFTGSSRVDLYAIDPVSKQPFIVKTENKDKAYQVLKERLFQGTGSTFLEKTKE